MCFCFENAELQKQECSKRIVSRIVLEFEYHLNFWESLTFKVFDLKSLRKLCAVKFMKLRTAHWLKILLNVSYDPQ